MLVFGHRGAKGYAPENTLMGIKKALELGVDGVEIDVRSVDGKLFVIHDSDLTTTTSGTGSLYDFSYDEIRTLDAGLGERVPYLHEVLDLIGGSVRLNIEIKGNHCLGLLISCLNKYCELGYPVQKLLLSSFNHRELLEFKKLMPDIPLGALVYGVPHDLAAVCDTLGAASLHISRDFVTTELIVDARKRGVLVYVYTVNEQSELARFEALGIDGVFSDVPDIVVR